MKYSKPFKKLLEIHEMLDEEEDDLSLLDQVYKLRLLRLVHQIAAYTDRPTSKEIDRKIKEYRQSKED